MPNIKSTKKRVLTNAKKEKMNTLVTSRMKTSIKKVEKAVALGNKEDAKEQLREANKNIDKALNSGVIHKNKAARTKARLTKMENKME